MLSGTLLHYVIIIGGENSRAVSFLAIYGQIHLLSAAVRNLIRQKMRDYKGRDKILINKIFIL